MKIKIDIKPTTHVISSIINQRMEPWVALAELIDNSVDAEATHVDIDIGSEQIVVRDNGRGIHPDNISTIIQIGNHRKLGLANPMGQYGIGAKDAILGLGTFAQIITCHGGRKTTVSVDWKHIENTGAWEVTGETVATKEKNGTTIIISNLHRTYRVERICNRLRQVFYPTLISGFRIRINKGDDGAMHDLRPVIMPTMRERIVERVRSEDGKLGFHVEAGLVDNNPNKSFLLAYKTRIIGDTDQPNMDYVPGSKFMAYVVLDPDDWDILKHKDGLRETAKSDWLYRRLNEVCEPLLNRCHQMAQDIKLDEISSSLDAIFEFKGGEVKPRKAQALDDLDNSLLGKRTGPVTPVATRTGGKKRRRSGGFKVLIEAMGKENKMHTVSHQGDLVVVRLNSDYRAISDSRENFEILRLHALYALLMYITMGGDPDGDPRQMLLALDSVEPESKYHEAAGRIFRDMGLLRRERLHEVS
ncbi:hypothetical protein EBS57_08385 [bacterium]|nr:hypothetical protein [bacterium]